MDPRSEAFVGSEFAVGDADGNGHTIHVAGVGRTRFWAGTADPVTTYVLTVASSARPKPRALCTSGRNEAILFTGDRYDAPSRTISATGGAATGWINIACADTALSPSRGERSIRRPRSGAPPIANDLP